MSASSPIPARKPRIGVTPEGVTDDGQLLLPLEYLQGIQRAGGVAIVLPPWDADANDLLAVIDGLLLAGGADIAPHRYGSGGHPEIYGIDEARDAGELALFNAARQRGLPILGICRGAQLVNVALGGTLIAHLPDRTAQPHRATPPGPVRHTVTIPAGSLLRGAMPGEDRSTTLETVVSSWHHQAIDRLADGLTVSAAAEDGTIEAVELPGGPWLVAVQWHPEHTAASDPAQQNLFNAFITAASSHLHSPNY